MENKKTLTEVRVGKDLSQVELSNLTGVAPSTIVNAEMGRPIFRSTLQKICTQLGVKPSDLDGVVVVRRIGHKTRKQ